VAAEVGEAAGGEEMKEGVFATDVTGLDILQGSALRAMELRGAGADLCATGATGWAILPGSVPREREEMREEEGEDAEIGILEVVVDPSATNATGLDISPESVARKKTDATSATALATLLGIAVRTRIRATTAMRLDTS